MASVVRMPGISADADEATLVEWAVGHGDEVRRGDVIATVETDKAVVDIEAEDDGVLLVTFAAAGETVAIGGPMAVLLQNGEQAADEKSILAGLGLGGEQGLDAPVPGDEVHDGAGRQSSGPLAAADEERSQDDLALGTKPPIEHTVDQVVSSPAGHAGSSGSGSNGSGSNGSGRVFATPLVRRLAAEGGTSLDGLRGTGPNGRIRRRDLEAARAAANTLQQQELEGGSLAISNLGMYGVEEFTAIINPPQAGILAVGAVSPQAVEGDSGTLVLARCLKVVLSVDHRPVDGALAAQWLQQFKTVIENPLQLVV